MCERKEQEIMATGRVASVLTSQRNVGRRYFGGVS
jgi:hypothetical protein